MSRIGKQPVTIPAGVKVKIADGKVFVEGPKGKLELATHRNVKVEIGKVTREGKKTTFKYNAAGERVIKRGPLGETAYVNQYWTVRNRTVATKHIFVGGAIRDGRSDGVFVRRYHLNGTADPFPAASPFWFRTAPSDSTQPEVVSDLSGRPVGLAFGAGAADGNGPVASPSLRNGGT